MDARELLGRAKARAEELPGALLEHPFGAEWDVYKVRDKVFMLLTETTGEAMVILKSAPADSQVLRETHAEITPGYHMNKRHWISVSPGGRIDRLLFDDLVTESYLLVVEKLPKYRRPVDPDTFGRRAD